MKYVLLILAFVAIVVLLRLSIIWFGPSEPGRSGLADTPAPALQPCPGTPNCYRVNVQLEGNADAVIEQISKSVAAEKGKVVDRTDSYLQATFQSRLLAFTDDFECLVLTSQDDRNSTSLHGEDKLQLQCRSASRIGHSDFGANKKRVNAILNQAGIQAA